MRGKSYNGFTVNFGERCQFRILTDDKYEDRWQPGVFVGKKVETDEFIALTEKGVISSRSCKRYASKVDAYDLDYLSAIKGLPWAPLGDTIDGAVKTGKDFMVGGASIRRMYITEQMLKEHGRTDGCPRCENYGATHSEECRRRIEAKMTAAGQAFNPEQSNAETRILVEEHKTSLAGSSSSNPGSSSSGSSNSGQSNAEMHINHPEQIPDGSVQMSTEVNLVDMIALLEEPVSELWRDARARCVSRTFLMTRARQAGIKN